ncbi:MAG: hypothetical protein NVSMB31_06820 [Vulcanimicrobiaceae bacterium]
MVERMRTSGIVAILAALSLTLSAAGLVAGPTARNPLTGAAYLPVTCASATVYAAQGSPPNVHYVVSPGTDERRGTVLRVDPPIIRSEGRVLRPVQIGVPFGFVSAFIEDRCLTGPPPPSTVARCNAQEYQRTSETFIPIGGTLVHRGNRLYLSSTPAERFGDLWLDQMSTPNGWVWIPRPCNGIGSASVQPIAH